MSEILTPKKLIARLANYAVEDKANPDKANTFVAAAAMLRNQKARIEKLRTDYDRLNDFEKSQSAKLLAQLAAVAKERDAAVEVIRERDQFLGKGIECKSWNGVGCKSGYTVACCHCHDWKWRGCAERSQ